MKAKILITPKSFANYKDSVYPDIVCQGYEIIENRLGRTMTGEEIVELASEEVVGIIIGIDPLPAGVLRRCKDLRAVSKYGMGTDNIDLDAARELNIEVQIAAGTNNVSVAEHTIGLLFAAARRIPKNVAEVKLGHWERMMGIELTGKTIGVVGGGQIGREVAIRAKGIGMRVLLYDPFLQADAEAYLTSNGIRRIEQLEELLAQSDAVSLHVPYTPNTKHLINAETINRMKHGAMLINTSRGELVDEEVLYEALLVNRISAAAQDVFSVEPPEIGNKLVGLDNFFLTSHTGAYTKDAVERMATVSTRNLLEMLGRTTERRL
ncbi:phosphoglycerate dehydrogenase [Cohnella lupini]|uniref:D-3-phosphoglycerate dehydrogenase n=1 Tax=Cohnella lupini TaxID=1294267 RepID=A0A3D9IXD4_9BACL|nr:phosphoglycerate dehydrogenase [Cohnella lupini]RED66169.1 D-3-phosphoglycerate dehydrogenase [Cohnella lupini]